VVRLFELAGVHTPARPGLARLDAVWRTIAKASIVAETSAGTEFVVLTSGTVRGGPLSSVVGDDRPIRAVIDVAGPDALERLAAR
jgi:site-specific DNA-methyltransferase (adenine-specific)